MIDLPSVVRVTDVVTRDGFQNEARIVSTTDKLRVIEGLVRAGVRSIEVTSFVHPSIMPQLADAAELVAVLPRHPSVVYSALVPNVKGARRALDAGITRLHLVVSVSELHNRANLNRGVDESLAQLAEVCAYVRETHPEAALEVTLATTFHSPFEGRTPLDRVIAVIEALVGMGIRDVNLADTDGAANPRQVYETVTALRRSFSDVTWSLHLHNTRDLALANAVAGLQAGVTQFDASLGGIGGCPFAPSATGNVATEDLVHMLHEMGIATGIDLDVLLAEDTHLHAMVRHDLASQIAKAGPSDRLHPFEGVVIADTRRFTREEALSHE